MKITDLQLQQYGIYQDVSWRPVQGQLVVVMGENESGKTTLLNFIRDMLFGYRRGMWRGRRGNLGFLRDNGEAWRVYRDEKNGWFEDSRGETYAEELPLVWWHGLNRAMYEKIFAVGLEDLQGTGFLSQDDVRSRFLMIQGGDRLADAKAGLSARMEELLLPSAQGKRKINQLMEQQKAVQAELDQLSAQEETFAELQKKRAEIKKEIEEISSRLVKEKAEDKAFEKKLGAWKYYTRAREIKRQLALSEQVKLFPKNGKEQWNQLMSRMEMIHDQREQLQKKLDEYTPKAKEEIIPWADAADSLERLYTDLGQWSQTIEDLEELKNEKTQWRSEFSRLGYTLPLWDRMISPNEEFSAVNWEDGRKLAQSVTVRDNELHFWEQREPEVEELDLDGEEAPKQTEEEWHAFEEKANQAEALLHSEMDLQEELDALTQKEDTRYTVWFWLGIAGLAAAVGGMAAFYMAFAGFAALYGAAGGALLAVVGFWANSHAAHKKEKQMEKLQAAKAELAGQRKTLAEDFPIALPEKEEDLQVFHNALQQKRSEFYKAQAQAQALSWKMESLQRQKNEHKKWEEEGASLREEKQRVEEAWEKWLEENHLPKTGADSLSALQEEWQKLYTAQGVGKILDVRIEKTQEKLDAFVRRALSIIRASGMTLEATPETIADIYEENRKRTLAWEAISEKNRQHEVYQKEMEQLNAQWDSCQKSVQTLFALVNAKNAEEFAERVTAHEQHDQLMKEWESVRKDIRLYAGSEEEFSRLWNSLETGEYDEWMEAHKALLDRIDEDGARLGELQKQQGAAENEIYRLAGDDRITHALQEREEVETELRSAVEEWLSCMFASHFLKQAQLQYESGRQPKIVKKANEFLEAMTGGRYQLHVSEDGKSVYTTDRQHDKKDARFWSSGTGDQVYLALRLAMALAFGWQMEPLPIVLDDIFVRFDEGRQQETLRFLMDLGKEQQIFLFTCHAQTMRLAEEIGKEKQAGSFVRLRNGKLFIENQAG